MEWLRAHEDEMAIKTEPLDTSGEPGVPKFVLVDSNKRVRELTSPIKIPPGGGGALGTALLQHQQQYQQHPEQFQGYGMTAEELAEQAQLEQQLRYQQEEMRFVAPLPRPSATSSHQYEYDHHPQKRPLLVSHAFSYSDSSMRMNPLKTPPTIPPISPFANMALSAPAKTTIGSSIKSPNPFGASLSSTVDSSPRLPSFNMFRAGSPAAGGSFKMGIAARPPPLSLRSTSESSIATTTAHMSSLPSLSSSLTSSSLSSSSPLYSQSLPSVSYLHDRSSARMSFDGTESANLSSEEETDPRDGIMLLSSSVERANGAMVATPRSGRVCRYANCNNIARSRGLCRTHGGGKRCSHPNCNKSAQANRKCIAHGGGTPCSFGDCEKTAQSRGLCKAHGGGARCKHPDCPKSSQSKGLCRGHGGGIKCKETGCEKWVQKNGYCIKHGRERSMTS